MQMRLKRFWAVLVIFAFERKLAHMRSFMRMWTPAREHACACESALYLKRACVSAHAREHAYVRITYSMTR